MNGHGVACSIKPKGWNDSNFLQDSLLINVAMRAPLSDRTGTKPHFAPTPQDVGRKDGKESCALLAQLLSRRLQLCDSGPLLSSLTWSTAQERRRSLSFLRSAPAPSDSIDCENVGWIPDTLRLASPTVAPELLGGLFGKLSLNTVLPQTRCRPEPLWLSPIALPSCVLLPPPMLPWRCLWTRSRDAWCHPAGVSRENHPLLGCPLRLSPSQMGFIRMNHQAQIELGLNRARPYGCGQLWPISALAKFYFGQFYFGQFYFGPNLFNSTLASSNLANPTLANFSCLCSSSSSSSSSSLFCAPKP